MRFRRYQDDVDTAAAGDDGDSEYVADVCGFVEAMENRKLPR